MNDTTGWQSEHQGVGSWLRGLRDLAREWVERNGGLLGWIETGGKRVKEFPIPTDSYVDLIFSFGLARLGEHDACRELLCRASEVLGGTGDEVHQFLLRACSYRIVQGLEGKPHTGPLPAEQIEHLRRMDRLHGYAVDR